MSTESETTLVIDGRSLDLESCLEAIANFLEAVQAAAGDYYNSTPVLTLHDALGDDAGTDVSCSCRWT